MPVGPKSVTDDSMSTAQDDALIANNNVDKDAAVPTLDPSSSSTTNGDEGIDIDSPTHRTILTSSFFQTAAEPPQAETKEVLVVVAATSGGNSKDTLAADANEQVKVTSNSTTTDAHDYAIDQSFLSAGIDGNDASNYQHTNMDKSFNSKHIIVHPAQSTNTIATPSPPITSSSTSTIKWSTILATPTLSQCTPSMDGTILSSSTASPSLSPSNNNNNNNNNNLHGLGLKYCVDQSMSLSRTCGGCTSLLIDLASLHDELSGTLGKLFPTIMSILVASSSSSSSSPSLEQFASGIHNNLQSLANQTQSIGDSLRTNIAKPYQEWASIISDESMKQYNEYNGTRLKCVLARKEAERLRMRYVECVNLWEASIRSFRKAARAAAQGGGGGKKKKSRKAESLMSETSSGGSSSVVIKGGAGSNGDGEGDEIMQLETTIATSTTTSATSWMNTLRQLGNTYNVSKQCESVIRAHDEMQLAQTNYTQAVMTENAAVEEVMAIEKMALDSVQHLEEERVTLVIGLVGRFLQDEKESLENMSLDPPPTVDPLDVSSSSIRELPVPPSSSIVSSPPPPSSQPVTAAAAAAMFMNPRRRAQSDEPAINETRQLNLPDNIAEIRDNIRSMIGRRINRLRTMKLIATFNEDMASVIDNFASCLESQIERSQFYATLTKNGEGVNNVISAWNSAIGSLEMYARNAELLSKQILKENDELQRIIALSERGAKILSEREEVRWKSLCDAAKIELKAKAKHKQYLLDLQKARARLTSVEEGSGGGGDDTNVTPRKTTKKIDKHVNKAMGKMFSILPGGGEEVMNKVLTPQQRLAIASRQLDEAEGKEGKVTEIFENARAGKEQAITSYTAEANVAEVKFKSEERSEWVVVQTSLLGSINAMRNFRDEQVRNVTSMILTKNNLQDKALEDVAGWAVATEKRVRDHLARCGSESTKDDDAKYYNGFCLKVQLVKCSDMQETIRHLLDDDDDDDDDVDVSDDKIGVEYDATSDPPSNDMDGVVHDTPLPPLSDVPADSVMKKMDPIFSKTLSNVSIEEYYLSGWSEEETPLYGRWLKRKGSFDITVGEWEHSTEKGFEHAWSGETFPLKRVIQFKFRRTTHLYVGSPIASVTQTQYLMKDGNDRCIVMMTVDIDGVPYSDSFAVEVRWAARRLKEKDLAIDAGVFVRFTKSNMFASKIKSGTLKETSGLHLDLFEVIKSAITSTENGGAIADVDVEEPDDGVTQMSTEVEGEMDAAKVDTPSHYFEGILSRSIVAGSSLSQRHQLLLLLFVLYFVTTMFFLGTSESSSNGEVTDLVRKVEDLTKEVREMKAMLEKIIHNLSDE